MSIFPPKRLAVIPAAIHTHLAVIELSNVEREAALKIPIKDAVRELAQRTNQELEMHLKLMVEAYLDADLLDPQTQIGGRLTLHPDSPYATVDGEPQILSQEERGETYALDGEPILWVGPVQLVRRGDPGSEEMTANRSFRYYRTPRAQTADT